MGCPAMNPSVAEKHTSAVFGNYLAALRSIETGETVVSEIPLSIAPFGPDDTNTCLSCGSLTALSKSQVCRRCQWPTCGLNCEANPEHAENECPIFAQCQIAPISSESGYYAIATLRCLLLRGKDPTKWNQILLLEGHHDAREQDASAALIKAFVTHFIQDRCNLKQEFDAEIINRILGVLSINTFGAKNFERHLSLLYGPSVSLIAHNCDPNLKKKYISTTQSPEFVMKFICDRRIECGEPLTFSYLDPTLNVIERGQRLKKLFYFHCDCGKCRADLFDEILFLDKSY